MPASGGGHDTEEARAMLRGAKVVQQHAAAWRRRPALAHRAGGLSTGPGSTRSMPAWRCRLRSRSGLLPAPEMQARLKMLGDLSGAPRARGAQRLCAPPGQKQRVVEG